ncbi:MAG: hypothetical protein NWF01_03755 [Candidatus Bathyarchaeota archaeon]|nr:hypothetical protein [Candidatus Bathyarchaeota archaeon]
MSGKRTKEKRLSKAVVLMRNSNWRCGKLERSIILYLQKKNHLFKKDVPVKELVSNSSLSEYSRDECLDAIKRLEQRKIVMLLS